MEKLESLVNRLEKAVDRLENMGGADLIRPETINANVVADGGDAHENPSYCAYSKWVDEHVTPFVQVSTKLGDDIATIGNLFQKAILAQQSFMLLAAKHSKPKTESDLQKCIESQVKSITAVNEFRECSRRSKYFNHLTSVSEAIPALSWILVSPAPMPYVKEMKDAAMFYTNRILKEYKEKDETHVKWTKLLLGALNELSNFIKDYHRTGLIWNAKGSPVACGNNPPPPPPPPVPMLPKLSAPAPKSADVDHSQLFASLNKGSDVTKGLKKVTADMQTHKNPNLRESSAVPVKVASSPTPKVVSKYGSAVTKKKPVMYLDGKKWMIEHQDANKAIEIEATMKQTVYIYKCVNSNIKVTGKVNSITLDACKKCSLVFDNSVAALEVIGSQSIQAQVTGKVPIINVDKTDGFQLYLSMESIGADIVTAKVSEVNIMIPSESGDYLERPVVEQFRTYWDAKKKILVTEPADIAA